MKKITEEEASKMKLKLSEKGSLVRNWLMNMKPGELIQLEPGDWKWKRHSPSTLCRRIEKENSPFKFQCHKIVNGSGWLIKRIR